MFTELWILGIARIINKLSSMYQYEFTGIQVVVVISTAYMWHYFREYLYIYIFVLTKISWNLCSGGYWSFHGKKSMFQ